MTDVSTPGRNTRTCAWHACSVIFICLVLSLGTAVIGCGGDSSDPATTATTASGSDGTTATTIATGEMSPSELADAIVATWVEVMQELNVLLEGLPGPASVQPDVEALKEEYIHKLVELGRVKEVLDEADRASVDSDLRSRIFPLSDEAWYITYKDTYDDYAYASGNVEFCNLLASFNILTQYADFTLLKQQLPDEASRLGIE